MLDNPHLSAAQLQLLDVEPAATTIREHSDGDRRERRRDSAVLTKHSKLRRISNSKGKRIKYHNGNFL
jgi:hypothetical protein